MALLRLIRLPNLIIIALTQWLVYWHILARAFRENGLVSALSLSECILLILATCSVAAAGYIVNDLVDYRIDVVNRKTERPIVGRLIGRGGARWLYFCFTIGGFLLCVFLAFAKNELEWLWLYPAISILLAWYPLHMKRSPWVGNVVVAVFCAATAGLIWLAERGAWEELGTINSSSQLRTTQILILFMVFAFLATWMRELVKDLEDLKGDAEYQRRTMPVVLGVDLTKRFVSSLGFILVAALLIPIMGRWPGFLELSMVIINGGLVAWLGIIIWKTRHATVRNDYAQASLHLKFFLLGGLLLLLIYQI